MFTCKYEDFDKGNGQHCLYMSSKLNEPFVEKYFANTKDAKDKVLATLFISAWQIDPIKDAQGNVVGSHAFYVYHADSGGSIPSMLSNSKGPGIAIDALQGAVKFLKKKKGQ